MKRKKPSCDCADKVQKILDDRDLNTVIVSPMLDRTNKTIVSTEQRRGGRGAKKACLIVATYCPFCGVKYDDPIVKGER